MKTIKSKSRIDGIDQSQSGQAMSRCRFCGSSDMWSCGMEFSFRGLRTTNCYVREIEALKKKIQRLKDAAKKGKL